MKRIIISLPAGLLIVLMSFQTVLLYAQTAAKLSLPRVPISYPGDTDAAILRRAQWTEGAKKEGKLSINPMVSPWCTLALADGGWGIEKTEIFLKKLKEQKPVYTSSFSAANSLLISGEFKIASVGLWFQYLQAKEKGAPVEWARVSPVLITGPSFVLLKNAPHPNAARLFLEWLFSPQGLLAHETNIHQGAAFPGSGTKLSKAVEGMVLIYRTEEMELKTAEMGLEDKFMKILGITP